MERKVGSGRKGTVDEEEYLLKSLTKLAGRFVTAQGMCLTFPPFQKRRAESIDMRCYGSVLLDETAALVPHLLRFTPLHRTAARELKNEVASLLREMAEAFDEVWPATAEDTEVAAAEPPDSWATRIAEREKERERAIKAITRPDLRAAGSWCTKLLDAALTAGRPEKT